MAVEQNSSPPNKKRSFVLNAFLFVSVIIVVLALWFVWDIFLSPEARSIRQMEKNYASYEEWEQKYNQALAEDTYGGATPEETLRLFIEALEQKDIGLASKYFMIDTGLSRQKWVDWLTKIKDEGNLERFAGDLKKVVGSMR